MRLPPPHVPPCSLPPSTMSSHQDPYHHSDPNPIYYESGSESPVAGQLPPQGQLWPPTATTSDQSGYSQHHQSLDQVRNLLEAFDVEDTNYSLNDPGPSCSQSSTSLQDPGVGTGATYTNVGSLLPFVPHSLTVPLVFRTTFLLTLFSTCLSILILNLITVILSISMITLLSANFTPLRRLLCTMHTSIPHRISTPLRQLKASSRLSIRTRIQHRSSR
ncbi:hypothetical protein OG21DRAFT_287726 [Imleria badia]|nr:hypothetical protein OG21DRAFT_287726 [Imleria badia]